MGLMNMNKPAIISLAIALSALVSGTHAAAAVPARAVQAAHGAPRTATRTFNFSNIPVRSALQVIAEEGDFNLVVPDSVQGNLTLRLVDVTWEEALQVVLRLKGLQYRVDSNTRSVTVTR
jgi:type II secretory pathway component HofQ